MGEYVGEGVLAYFGDPTTQDNDAERAVRAALAIQTALSEHNSEKVNKGAPELSARIGLDCGLCGLSISPARCLVKRRMSPLAC